MVITSTSIVLIAMDYGALFQKELYLSGSQKPLQFFLLIDSCEILFIIHDEDIFRYSWKVRFNSPGGDFPQMLPDASSLSSYPGPVELIGETTAIGGLNLSPIQGDYLKTAHDTPQVRRFVC